MLKNKRNREKVQQRQHQKDRDHLPPNPDVHILQHTVNIDTIPEQIPGARGTHISQGPQGGSHNSYYSPDETSSFQQNSSISIHVTGSNEHLRNQRFPQQKSNDLVKGSTSYHSSDLQQQPAHGRYQGKEIQGGSASQISNGGSLEHSRSLYDRKGQQKPHRPGKNSFYINHLHCHLIQTLINTSNPRN